jgi:putative thioredoxin
MILMTERIPDISSIEFADKVVAASSLEPVLVEFWAPWCGPCRLLFPMLQKLATGYAGRLTIVKVDVDSAPDIAKEYQVTSVPVLKLFKNGKVVVEKAGLMPEANLRRLLAAHLES